ncbi:MAG: C40 family peptidase [Pseudolysinimonas sp.]|uniref:C40 family peptidase n=1 Tax=Pseudolysinimonas sp. TaxID=2680009 RepID=UPI00326786D0
MFLTSPEPTGSRSAIVPLPAPASTLTPRIGLKARVLPILVMGVAVPAIFCTVALPAYAYSSAQPVDGRATAALEAYKTQDAQTVDVVSPAAIAVARDDYTATSAADMRRSELAAAARAYSGPSVSDLLKNPPYPNYDPATIVSIAEQYLGVPYVFGGNSPAGFDCSGLTQFVFANVGISLPHSSSAQGRMQAIDPAAALPGDLVVLDGGHHVGIYIGGGQMIHAPMPGTVVRIGKPWGDYWFVRPGI